MIDQHPTRRRGHLRIVDTRPYPTGQSAAFPHRDQATCHLDDDEDPDDGVILLAW